MNYQEADELAAEKGRIVPFEMSQRQAEYINKNINTLFLIMKGVHNEPLRNDSRSK